MITRINRTYSSATSEPTTTEFFFDLNEMLQMNESLNNSELPFCDGSDRVQYERKYLILPILLISCFIAMVVNIIVISSAYWIRCSMTPNLKISLSLAAADATSSTMYGLLLLISEYGFSLGMIPCLIDLLRLSGIVITVVHLLALSLNHYIGILKPLHYNSIVTSRKVSAVIWVLWLVPFVTVVSICTGFDSDGTFWNNFLNNTDVPPL
ncbi:adenosine receptor A2b-like [Dendroctonus ponderosae]|uniref:adenosine receptor A2b-like n=1 Tax=Dendroctonus ponderosae TaxID=77166 RepID=UPI0020361C2A|nr:adenosine receptor A2b-like [Dendroctonus ponderosae]